MLCEISNSSNFPLLGMFAELNPPHAEKLLKSSRNPRDILPKRLDIPPNQLRLSPEVTLIIRHRQKRKSE